MKRKPGRLTLFSVGLNFVLILAFAGKRFYYARPEEPAAKTASWGDIWNKERTDVFTQLSIDHGDIVFVGNSLTEGFPLMEIFPGRFVKNRGIGWNESRHVLQRIAEIASHQPKKIFLEMGINDFNSHVPVDTVFNNYRRTIDTIRRISPATLIYIQSVTPNGMKYIVNQPSIIRLNSLLKGYCHAENIGWIDLYPLFLKDNALDSNYTYDGIHLNGIAYYKWRLAIDSLVN